MNVNKKLFISLTIMGLLLAGCANNTKPVEPNNPPVIEEKEDFKDVYFDENGYYQGEYEQYGEVVDKTSSFVSYGGVVHYFSEWHS